MNPRLRSDLRFVALETPASRPARACSAVLRHLLSFAQVGLFDGWQLFDRLDRLGLRPRWQDWGAFWIQDPDAGLLLVRCEPRLASVH